jgi:hypothetical protein
LRRSALFPLSDGYQTGVIGGGSEVHGGTDANPPRAFIVGEVFAFVFFINCRQRHHKLNVKRHNMNNILLSSDIENKIKRAIRFFWNTRDGQISRQTANDVHDQGNRGAVTGGKQLDGFLELIREFLIENEVAKNIIFTDTKLELPGYYRPSKKWDLLVVDEERLILAIELKSQVGPSFGNNFNNRTEEAMGSALDIWTAFREGVFKNSSPWLGYLMVLEDCSNSSSTVSIRSPHFRVMSEFENSSYIKRYEIFCNKLVLERQYNAACFLTSRRCDAQTGDFKTPDKHLSFNAFLASMLSAVFAYRTAKGTM